MPLSAELFIPLLLIATVPVGANAATARYTVVDGATGAPILGARVTQYVAPAGHTACEASAARKRPPGGVTRQTDAQGHVDFPVLDLTFKPPCPDGAPCLPYQTPPPQYAHFRVEKPGYLTFDSMYVNSETIRLIPASARIASAAAAVRASRKMARVAEWLKRYPKDYPTICGEMTHEGRWHVLFQAEPSPHDSRSYVLPTFRVAVDPMDGSTRFVSCPDEGSFVSIVSASGARTTVKDQLTDFVYECGKCDSDEPGACARRLGPLPTGHQLSVGSALNQPAACRDVGASDISFRLFAWDPVEVHKWKRNLENHGNVVPALTALGSLSDCKRVR